MNVEEKLSSVMKRLDMIEKKLSREGDGKKDMDSLKPGPECGGRGNDYDDEAESEDMPEKKKKMAVMIAMLKARKGK